MVTPRRGTTTPRARSTEQATPGPGSAGGRRRVSVSGVGTALGAAVVAALLVAGCGGAQTATPLVPGTGTGATSTSTTTASASGGTGAPNAPPAVPAHGAYLGAWLHPTAATSGQSSFAEEQANVPTVLAATGRPLGLLHVYSPWARPAPVSQLRAVVGDGSVPILDWGCGPDVTQVAGGADDSLISAYAEALKSFQGPVFLRWCWEMNLVGSHPQVGGPSRFISAWDHIRAVFHSVGASNVSFVWCPAVAGVDPTPYFPGASEVDWIGVDGYDRTGGQTFASLFGAFVNTWQGQGKPLMVAETGASGSSQAAFIDSIGADAPALPAVKAVAYFDAPGPADTWQFTPAGLVAFGHLAATPYFHPE